MTDIRTRLREVERLDPPNDLWQRASETDPVRPLPAERHVASGWHRVAAIAAAFAVFAAAAIFGWQALWPSDVGGPVGPAGSMATISLSSTEDAPTAIVSFRGAEQAGQFSGYTWCRTPGDCNTLTFDFNYPSPPLEIPAGTSIRFDGEGRVEGFVVWTVEDDRPSDQVVVESDGSDASIPADAGDYMLRVDAAWEQGSGSFYLRVRATSPSDGVLPPDSNAPVRFLPADGWVSEADAGGGEDPASAWTSNVEMTADGTFPALMDLPDNGVLLTVAQVGGEPPTADNPNFPPAELPLTLPEELETSWEGFVEGTSRHKLWVAVEGRALDIAVYYGTTEPSDEQFAAAEAALQRLVVIPGTDEAGTFLDEVTHLPQNKRWAPSSTSSDGSTTMPITFPDGSTAELRYPSDLRLERYGVYPDMYGRLRGSPDVCGWPVHATRYDPRGGWVRGDRPLDSAATADGGVVELWEGTKSNAPHNFLISRIGEWNVIVACRGDVIDGDTGTWADNLSGSMTPDGLLVMRDSGPLDIHPGDSGATVRISGDDIVVDISVSPDDCVDGGATDLGTNDGVVEWCVGRSLHIYANAFAPSAQTFLQQLVEGLEVDTYRAAPA